MVADAGLRLPGLSAQWRLEVGVGVGGAVAATGQTALIRDYRRDPRRVAGLKAVLDAEELRSGVVVALDCGAPTVLYIAERDPRRFDESDIPLAEALASAASALIRGCLTATERARAGEVAAVVEELQQRLAAARDWPRSSPGWPTPWTATCGSPVPTARPWPPTRSIRWPPPG